MQEKRTNKKRVNKDDEKIQLIDQTLEICPDFKRYRDIIIGKIVYNVDKLNQGDDILLDGFVLNNRKLYHNEYFILNESCNIVGICKFDGIQYNYYILDTKSYIETKKSKKNMITLDNEKYYLDKNGVIKDKNNGKFIGIYNMHNDICQCFIKN